LKILWLNARLRDDSPEFRRHTGIGYRFVEEEKIEKL
jgi:hypothetical protein